MEGTYGPSIGTEAGKEEKSTPFSSSMLMISPVCVHMYDRSLKLSHTMYMCIFNVLYAKVHTWYVLINVVVCAIYLYLMLKHSQHLLFCRDHCKNHF